VTSASGEGSVSAARAPLNRAKLEQIGPHWLWRTEVLDESPSTNAVVVARARNGAPEGCVVVTEHQTAGRGRLDRAWETPARSALTFSALLRPPAEIPAERWPWLPLTAGVAVSIVLRTLGYRAGVKWPNDVLLQTPAGERKVCGILVERVETSYGPAAVVGIGLNTSLRADELPIATATSLEIESGARSDGAHSGAAAVDRTFVLLKLLAQLENAYGLWLAEPAKLAAAYERLSVTVGRDVRAELPGGNTLLGRAVRIDAAGRLVIAHDGGETAVGAGDVVHLRPA